MKQIVIDIDEDGVITIETRGFTGSDCLKATMELEKRLGGKKLKDIKTAEFYKVKERDHER